MKHSEGPKNCHRLEEIKERGQVNALWGPGLDLRTAKGY